MSADVASFRHREIILMGWLREREGDGIRFMGIQN
jgi:hypothetical protein